MNRLWVIGVLVGICCLLSPEQADSLSFHFGFEGVLGTPSGVSDLNRPSSVTVNPLSEELCVTDGGNIVLHVYNDHSIHTYQTGHIAGISAPMDGTIDTDGGFVFTDRDPEGGRTIRRLNFLGEPVSYEPEKPAPGWSPGRLMVGVDGHFLTIDEEHGRFAKHDSETGALLWSRIIAEDVPDQGALFGRPVQSPDGRIFVPGGELRRVLVLSEEGEFEVSFGRPGAGTGEFAFPVGVAFGPLGTILVLDRMRHTILLFDSEFRFIGEQGGFGARAGNFYHPLSIASLPDGRVWVAQGYESRVQAFRLFQVDGSTSMQETFRSMSDGGIRLCQIDP